MRRPCPPTPTSPGREPDGATSDGRALPWGRWRGPRVRSDAMARVSFTANLRRHVHCPEAEVPGATVAECLAGYFADHPTARSYVLDEQGAVRRHVVVFVDGDQIHDPAAQSDPVDDDGDIVVMQALSGGC